VQQEARGSGQGAEPVHDAHPEADRRGLLEVAGRDRHLDHEQLEVDRLEDHLGVEHEVVRVAQERHRLQEAPAVGAVAGVALGEPLPHRQVLGRGEETVGDALPQRHAAPLRRPRDEHARAEDHVGPALADRPDHLGDDGGVVLPVGVQHHDDGGPVAQRLHVAGLLVAAVADVVGVADRLQVERPRPLDGVVAAVVVHHDDLVVVALGDGPEGLLDRARRVVGGHDDDDLLPPRAHRRGALDRRSFGHDRGHSIAASPPPRVC